MLTDAKWGWLKRIQNRENFYNVDFQETDVIYFQVKMGDSTKYFAVTISDSVTDHDGVLQWSY